MNKNTAEAYSAWQDKEERDRILLEQLPQVRYLARRIHERLPRQVPLEDLVHAGVIGLIDALNKFDRSKHVQFGSYAKFRIRGAILDSLRQLDWALARTRPQPLAPFLEPVALAAPIDPSKRTYIYCTQDHAIPPALQRRMVKESPCAATHELDTDHSPFLSRPAPLARLLRQIAAELADQADQA